MAASYVPGPAMQYKATSILWQSRLKSPVFAEDHTSPLFLQADSLALNPHIGKLRISLGNESDCFVRLWENEVLQHHSGIHVEEMLISKWTYLSYCLCLQPFSAFAYLIMNG